MGQSSSHAISSDTVSSVGQKKQKKSFCRIRNIATVTYKEVLKCIEELNIVTRGFTDITGKQLRFVVKKGTDRTLFWKGTIRIYCLKLVANTSMVESSHLLTLRHFLKLHKDIAERVSALSHQCSDNLGYRNSSQRSRSSHDRSRTTSSFIAFPNRNEIFQEAKIKECCVCMDRKACIMLSCCHEFCEVCIDSWTRDEQHSNCPLCRTTVSGTDDTWVLAEKSDAGNTTSDVQDYLKGIANMPKANIPNDQ